MRGLMPFTSVSGRHNVTLFEVRLDNDFVVFRGNEHESSGQVLRGVVVLCLSSQLKIEEVRLRLSGTLRFAWPDARMTASGSVPNHKVDKEVKILEHEWEPLVGSHDKKSIVLQPGNYEWPFEYTFPGNTSESVEGIPEASLTYRLKATVTRPKLSSNITTYKPLRIIRTLDPSALEFHHAMSVENIWPNKIDYSIIVPHKAVVFGTHVTLQMRFTPLLKGLEMGLVTAKLVEIRECTTHMPAGAMSSVPARMREFRTEREAAVWKFQIERENHWRDTIEETGQEGWVVERLLNLPKRLRQCIQDLNQHGIKVRHKVKLTVALKNPDGHISELRATLPITIYISPNMPLDEQGNLISHMPGSIAPEAGMNAIAPPGYGEHVLDQLYENVDMSGFQTPAVRSGANTPYSVGSRSGSAEDLRHDGTFTNGVHPAALSSVLSTVEETHDRSQPIAVPMSIDSDPTHPLSQTVSDEHPSPVSELSSGRNSPEHIDFAPLAELNKVPSYATAVRTPARSRASSGGVALPDYRQSMLLESAPSSPRASFVEPDIDHERPDTMLPLNFETVYPPHEGGPVTHPVSMYSVLFPRESPAETRRRLPLLSSRHRLQVH